MAMFGGPWALAWAAGRLDAVASITLINTPVLINHFAAKILAHTPQGLRSCGGSPTPDSYAFLPPGRPSM